MSELEKKNINEMDAADLVAEAQKADRQRLAPKEIVVSGDDEQELLREAERKAKKCRHRKGWEAFGMACFHGLSVAACCAALLGNYWQLVLVGMAAANLIMVGGWLHKAEGWWSA